MLQKGRKVNIQTSQQSEKPRNKTNHWPSDKWGEALPDGCKQGCVASDPSPLAAEVMSTA